MIHEEVKALRHLMRKHGVQAYIVPGTDPHQSEYLPNLWQRRQFISGFKGSAGDVVITEECAGLWTDSRYYIQAEEQLNSKVYTLFKMGMPDVPTYDEWLAQNMKEGQKVGLDTRLFSYKSYADLYEKLEQNDVEICPIDENLIDQVWTDQPDPPSDPLKVHELKYAGESASSKLKHVREKMASQGVRAHVVTLLDAVAWLFNIRGTDVSYNPVAISYVIVTDKEATLYMDPSKINSDVLSHLGKEVHIKPYEEFRNGLNALNKDKIKTWLDPLTCSQWVVEQLLPDTPLLFMESPITHLKAIKNETEIEGFKSAHIRDGVALVRFFIWLEKAVDKREATECLCMQKLDEFRSQSELYQGPSFEAIVGFNEHGAIVHYTSTTKTDVKIQAPGILLIDSGGQYLDGTTDITRTIALGEPTDEQRDRFTRVLKGHIQLARQPFPLGTDGVQLDTLARTFLWEAGLNFGHGIGHGVGSYLNVHEKPPAISYISGRGIKPEPGMVCTNEPGYYKEGEYGFRQENMVVVREASKISKEGNVFLRLENLTLCPIDLNLVERCLLLEDEIAWLNNYHQVVNDTLASFLQGEEVHWLSQATRDI